MRGQSSDPTDARDPAYYGTLPGLKTSPDGRLRDELARIVEERGTPELLCQADVPEKDNVAAVLLSLFPPEKIESIRSATEEVVPPARFEFDAARLKKAIDLRKKYESERLRARDALRRPRCNFGIQFKAGLLADLKFIDIVWICARLEAFRAAEALSEDDTDEAIVSLGSMLRLASCLGAEKHAVARLEAAFLRTKAFAVLQAIVAEPRLGRRHVEVLFAMVRDQLQSWPGDADAWIGDRAAGMHAYEMVRDGRLVDLLTEEELERLTKEHQLVELTRTARRNVDNDEFFYLVTMRKVIDGCKQPYYARAALLAEIDDELQQLQNSPEFPAVAARLLLPEVSKGHAIQAQDRANWEAWALALAIASRQAMPPYEVNPLTAEKYRVVRQDDRVLVGNFSSGTGDQPWIVVPDAAGAEQTP